MRVMGLRKSLLLPLTAFFIVLVCFLLYYYPALVGRDDSKMILFKPTSSYRSQKQELIHVLRRATMPDRTVILTMVDESWARPGSMLEILLQSFKSGEGTQRFLNHLVIITMDPKAFEYCSSLHPYCIHPSTFAPHLATRRESITDPDQNHSFSWSRNDVLLGVLQLGYNIIFTDADVLWLRSPLQNFNPVFELTISCHFTSDDGGKGDYLQDGGIFFLKANAVAFEFFKHWKLIKVLFPNSYGEESLCTTIRRYHDIGDAYGFRMKNVDSAYFGGFCQLNKDSLRKAYTLHANCCEDLTSKVHDLRIVLDDWIRFRKRMSGDNASDIKALRWPQKCRI